MKHREAILFRQYVQERLADAACELYASSCTLARLDHLLTVGNGNPDEAARDVTAGRYYLRCANRRIRAAAGGAGRQRRRRHDGDGGRDPGAVLRRGRTGNPAPTAGFP